MDKPLEHRVEAMEQVLCEARREVKKLAKIGGNPHPYQYTPHVIETVQLLEGIFDSWYEARYDE